MEKDIKLKFKLLRRSFRRLMQTLHYGSEAVNNSPILFANSFPKSGTHLLIQILSGFSDIGPGVNSGLPPIVFFEGTTGRRRTITNILADINKLKPGDITYGHLHAEPEITNQLSSTSFATFNIIRDPRDVVVSHVHYITELASEHIHHKYFLEGLQNFDERLKYSITGSADVESENKQDQPGFEELPDIRSRLTPYLGWLDIDGVFNTRFETLISDQDGTIAKMLEFATERGFLFNKTRGDATESLKNKINPGKSPTFRSGKIGGWKEAFNEENKSIFKEIAGDLLIQLGYETDLNW